jgi:hypothetical protein
MKRKLFRKSLGLLFILLFGAGILGVTLGATEVRAAPEKIRLSMGGSNTGTWIYMFCATLIDIWKRYLPEIDFTIVATAGTTANYAPMEKGELDLAGAAIFGDWYAMHGMYFTKTKLTNFCSMIPATKSFSHAFTYLESPIKSWKDLDGKRVHLGARASPTSIVNEEICQALGIKPKFVFSTPTEAIDMVKDRRVDAMLYSVGAPWSAIMDIATDRPIKLISMTPEEQKKVAATLPYQVPDTIPAKTYSFQTQDYHTTMGLQNIIVRPAIPEEVVYKLTKAALVHWDEVVKATSAAKWVKAGDIVDMIAPIHPGAVKYYKEIGIQIPEKLILKK